MKRLMLAEVMTWGPCYDRERVEELAAARAER